MKSTMTPRQISIVELGGISYYVRSRVEVKEERHSITKHRIKLFIL